MIKSKNMKEKYDFLMNQTFKLVDSLEKFNKSFNQKIDKLVDLKKKIQENIDKFNEPEKNSSHVSF